MEADIISVKANMSSNPSEQLSDSELLDQCSTFLLAGSDSVSLALSWTLYYLALNPSMQSKIFDEIVAFTEVLGDKQSTCWDGIDSLPYLDAVVRETLRLCPPVHSSIRVATADDHIPVTYPITMRDGTIVQPGSTLKIRKGSYVHIPIEGLNTAPEIWGSDATTFKCVTIVLSLPPNRF
jgi:cytochrome P450